MVLADTPAASATMLIVTGALSRTCNDRRPAPLLYLVFTGRDQAKI
jgi:hypothetical protein